jgi:hypothetical protein
MAKFLMRTFTCRSTFLYGVCQMRILSLFGADKDPESFLCRNYAVLVKKASSLIFYSCTVKIIETSHKIPGTAFNILKGLGGVLRSIPHVQIPLICNVIEVMNLRSRTQIRL